MLNATRSENAELERIFALSIEPVATDLRLLELQHLVGGREAVRMTNVEGLVNSSIELYFKPDTLLFGNAIELQLDWGRHPSVVLEMEFHHQGVHAYFRLGLQHRSAGVELSYLHFENPPVDASDKRRQLGDALRSAASDNARRQQWVTLGTLVSPTGRRPRTRKPANPSHE